MDVRVRMLLAPDAGSGSGSAAVAAPAAGGTADSGGAGAAPAAKPGSKAGLTPGDQAAMAALGGQGNPMALPDGWYAAETRPEWVPERFYDPEKKAIRAADIAKSWAEADKKIASKTEDLKSLVKKEFDEERMKARPETPDKYVAKLPESFKLPEGAEYKPDESNPMMKWWRDTAHKAGLSQEEFEGGIATYLDSLNHGAPDLDAEMKKLGEKGPARVNALTTFLRGKLGEDKFKALAPVGASAAGIEALEALMRLTMDPTMANEASQAVAPLKSEAELRQMMQDDRYRNEFKRDPAFVKQVKDGFAALAGRR